MKSSQINCVTAALLTAVKEAKARGLHLSVVIVLSVDDNEIAGSGIHAVPKYSLTKSLVWQFWFQLIYVKDWGSILQFFCSTKILVPSVCSSLCDSRLRGAEHILCKKMKMGYW